MSPVPGGLSQRTILVAGAACASLAWVMLAVNDQRNGTLRDEFVGSTIGWYVVAFVGFALVVAGSRSIDRFGRQHIWLLALPVVHRLLLLTTTPTLSDDVYRYLWDGALAAEGQNPYRAAVNSPSLDSFEIAARALVNNPDLSTPYLPGAFGLFGGLHVVGPAEPWVVQLAMIGFDLATAAILVALLRVVALPDARVLLWLWNPLVIVEVAHGAHIDAAMVFFMILASWATLRVGRSFGPLGGWALWLGPVALAAGTLMRMLPILIAPILWWRWKWPQRVMYPALVAGAIVPFGLDAGWGFDDSQGRGTGVFGATRVYADQWVFNSAIFQRLEEVLVDRDVNDPGQVARVVLFAAMALVMLWVTLRAHRLVEARDLLRVAAVPFGAFAILTTTLHPWYLLSFVSLAIFLPPGRHESPVRWALVAPWAWLVLSVVFSYLTYRDPLAHAERPWVRTFEWLPLGVLLIAALVGNRLMSRSVAHPAGAISPEADQ